MGQLPKHIAIVMDGNGRWAMQRKLPRIAGHRVGSKVVKSIVEYCGNKGIEVLSLFAFSLENRGRPPTEVQFLMKLMLKSLQRDSVALHENNVRLRIIGDRQYLDAPLLAQVQASEKLTRNNTGLILVIALNYSGRWDIAQASKKLFQSNQSVGDESVETIEKRLQQHLSTGDLPSPDLLIRTSGEQRISNFMLWQLAYSEIFFTEVYWPDFNESVIDQALEFYQSRQRRFGLTPQQVDEYAKT